MFVAFEFLCDLLHLLYGACNASPFGFGTCERNLGGVYPKACVVLALNQPVVPIAIPTPWLDRQRLVQVEWASCLLVGFSDDV